MRILLNTSALLAPLTGIGQYVQHLAKALSLMPEHQLRCFTGFKWSASPPTASTPTMLHVAAKTRRILPFGYDITRLLQSAAFHKGSANADIYHEPCFLPLPYTGKTVVTVHDLSWLHYPQYHPKTRIAAMERYFFRSINRVAHFITDSEFVRQEVIKLLGIPENRVTSVALGIEDDFHTRSETECAPVLKRYELSYKSFFLVVGTLEPRKNLTTILEAYQNLNESMRLRYPLVIAGMAGWGDSPFSKPFAALLSTGQVRYLGYLPRREVLEVISAARGLLYPSLYEGFGLPPLEAMGCGVVPLVSAVSSLPEVVGELGLQLPAQDVAAWTEGMERLVTDPDLHTPANVARLVCHARQFNWQKCAAETVDVYRTVLYNQ